MHGVMNQMARDDRRSRNPKTGDQSLEEKLKDLRQEGKAKLGELRRREEDAFMTPGQRKRDKVRKGKQNAAREARDKR